MKPYPNDTIFVPDAPGVPGLIFRHFRGESDYPAYTDVGNRVREADGQEWVFTVEDTVRIFAHLENSDPAQDMIVAEIDGEMVGCTLGEWWQVDNGPRRYWFELDLVPEYRGRGIRRAMLHWVEARLRVIAATHPPGEKSFYTYAQPRADSLTNLLEDEGYTPARYYNRMTRSLDDPIVDFPLPDGFEMRPVTPDHYRAIWDADDEAFQDHWGHVPATEERYQSWLEDPVIFQPDLWQVAWDTAANEIAGQVRTFIDEAENEKYGRRRGYTEFISVRRPYRRRGLARALIAESLRLQRARGMTESMLTVDSENPSGATRIYEDCGFRVVSRSVTYEKGLD